MTDLTEVSTGQLITIARQNLINDYIQNGLHDITTKSLIETVPSLLKLDQTNPQNIINGTPYFQTIRTILDNDDYTNTDGENSHILMTNPNEFGQNVVSSYINGVMAAKWRTDYVGNISWISNATDPDRGHYFFVGGDYGIGQSKMKICPGGIVVGNGDVTGEVPENPFEIQNLDNEKVFVVNGNGAITTNSISCSPTISSGTTSPSSTPAKVGDMYVDTTAKKIYVATGTTNSTDWTIIN
jgi:hypothetical protein